MLKKGNVKKRFQILTKTLKKYHWKVLLKQSLEIVKINVNLWEHQW